MQDKNFCYFNALLRSSRHDLLIPFGEEVCDNIDVQCQASKRPITCEHLSVTKTSQKIPHSRFHSDEASFR